MRIAVILRARRARKIKGFRKTVRSNNLNEKVYMNHQTIHIAVHLLPGMGRIVPIHQQAGQQPDNLCGPYWVAMLLRSHHILVTPEQVAQQAGSVLPIGDPTTWLPLGATSRQDYSLPLPETHRLADAGTSAQGLIEAIAHLSRNTCCAIPVQTEWTGDRLWQLLRLCQDHPEWEAVPLANLRTGHLWGASLGVGEAIAYLNGQPIQPPEADWNVGHFLVLAGVVQGSVRSLVWVCDTYPMFGWQGYHVQAGEAIAQALNRGDGLGGGILLFTMAAYQGEVEQAVEAMGFRVTCWDNGSPMPF